MEKKFTKGPWRRIKYKSGMIGNKIIAGEGMMLEKIADISEIYMDRGQREANARLIAEAPAMYDLLERFCEHCNKYNLELLTPEYTEAMALLTRINNR